LLKVRDPRRALPHTIFFQFFKYPLMIVCCHYVIKFVCAAVIRQFWRRRSDKVSVCATSLCLLYTLATCHT
jgi:hypothetical protein